MVQPANLQVHADGSSPLESLGVDIDLVKSALLWIAIGASGLAVGLVMGILFAPRSGSETRERLADSVNRLGEEMQRVAEMKAAS